MAEYDYITPEICRKFLRYEPDTGNFFWIARVPEDFKATPSRSADWICKNWNSRHAGKRAMNSNRSQGKRIYKAGEINHWPISAHRAAWAVFYGHWPEVIDHIDGDTSNNKIANLRDVTEKENAKNKRLLSNNKTGFHGVFWLKKRGEYAVDINGNKDKKRIGYFKNLEDAVNARKEAEIVYGYHENHGNFKP